jgi:3-hydroxybutyrate dehydrogenase
VNGPLAEKVALVTGGGRGIGRACALELAARGAAIAVTARTRGEIEAVAREVEAHGSRATSIALDVTDEDSVVAAFEEARATLGPIDILVNNAGIAPSAPFEKTDHALWERTIGTNLTGVFLCTRAAIGSMIQRGWGRVINVASVAGKVGYPYVTAYCASKHGVIGLTRALAMEVATKGVTVNAVCPGYVDTKMTTDAIERIVKKTGRGEEAARSALVSISPQGRLMTVDEVARLVAFLAEPGQGGINGQAINLDGGGVTV